jgi:hypothetical protein
MNNPPTALVGLLARPMGDARFEFFSSPLEELINTAYIDMKKRINAEAAKQVSL